MPPALEALSLNHWNAREVRISDLREGEILGGISGTRVGNLENSTMEAKAGVRVGEARD